MINKVSRNQMRVMRHARVRSKIAGTPEVPRLCVFRSNKNISCQIIDDVNGVTLASASTLDKEVKNLHGRVDAMDGKLDKLIALMSNAGTK